jgi:hypothetical protein
MRGTLWITVLLTVSLPPVTTWGADGWTPKVTILPGTPTRTELVGEWSQSEMSNVEFTNPNTGSFSDPSGERTNVRFFPDGSYRLGWLKQSSLYGCTMRLFGYKTGVYTLDGSGLEMQDQEASLTSSDNCRPQWNYKKPVPLKSFRYEMHLGRTKSGVVLVLRRPDGKDEVYKRETGTSLLGN